jgi:hypothetical protein
MKLPGTIPITKPSNPPLGAYPKTVGVSVLSPNVESMKNYTENIETASTSCGITSFQTTV